MRLVFAGAGDFALPLLAALIGSGHELALVLTQPARPAGRGRRIRGTPVQSAAAAAGLAIETPTTLKDPAVETRLQTLAPDALVVVAYGLIVPAAILAVPRHGGFNVHPSLLPRWRGAAPVERALAAGDRETGVAIMQMDAGLDTGPILRLERVPIGSEETAGELSLRLARRGAVLLLETLAALAAGRVTAAAQAGEASYAERITSAEARLDFADSAEVLARRIRAFNPRPGAWAECEGERIRLLRASAQPGKPEAAPGTIVAAAAGGFEVATGAGLLCVSEVQRAGRRIQPAAMLARDKIWLGRRLR
ncbi:MAG: methionyl-tRNA formyltransferase [Gammaproteobacteria bacterium]